MPVITRSVVFVTAIFGMGLSALMCSADVLQRAGDDYTARAMQETGEVRQKLLVRAVETYQLAYRLEPWQPSHAFKIGLVNEIGALTLSQFSDKAHGAWASVATAYGQAVRLHPANARLQASLAMAALQTGDLIGGSRAVHAALKFAPDYPDVRFTVARWHLMRWEALSPEERELTTSLVRRGARELPELYVDAVWQLVRDPKVVRRVLPLDRTVRYLLLNKLTERKLFGDRWAEQANHHYLRVPISQKGPHVLARGQLTGGQEPPPEAILASSWTGIANGQLSGGMTARAVLDLPPGEVVLYLRVRGEPAGGIWPILDVTLGGYAVPLAPITGPGPQTAYVLLSTPGGRVPLQAALTNGAVILENGQFIERRATLDTVRVLIPTRISPIAAGSTDN